MNQMQQMLMQAQKIQRELVKAHAELDQKDYVVKKAGIVEVTLKGSKRVASIKIEKDALTPDNEEMIEETIAMAINEAVETIKKESDAIDEKLTGQKGALPF
ncbi:MAG: YbaB/EbfC family nucleoid-associated protein [Bacilli bacterium]|jgi:DNA-binding YbaB/EbfC family protein|nr:YbaB/EbfC family nucleoid-associated protein [Bacilli bacterium]MCH4210162.1 YbaB/EbfC family nucleoid-associated protein [Bacilli bacterium]MCH4229088.1 YbaB/EbfC family nucleoid-associated protein [Bacilli bacterium]MCH4278260.1 YbaB/EbfC family nucleoid-associated protein [Bacilli bacterium]MCI2055408.1 YbaB/EbfC family nucleoid-associated protein [Bacilli bacterium]